MEKEEEEDERGYIAYWPFIAPCIVQIDVVSARALSLARVRPRTSALSASYTVTLISFNRAFFFHSVRELDSQVNRSQVQFWTGRKYCSECLKLEFDRVLITCATQVACFFLFDVSP